MVNDFPMPLKTIIKEELTDYVKSSAMVRLYHFTDVDVEELTLNPSMFGSKGYTQNDAKASDLPRVFFYVNPDQKERWFIGKPMYYTDVSIYKIYHLIQDPLKYKERIREQNNGVLNLDMYLRDVKTNGYRGAYYVPSGIEMVAWFYPIQVTRFRQRV